jgi:hypothetical protein
MESVGGHNATLTTWRQGLAPSFLVVTDDPLDVF